MHPMVWGAAARLWRDGYSWEAVAGASESVVAMVWTRTKRNDVSATALWQEAFSNKLPQPGKLRLRWPGGPSDQDVVTMNSSLLFFAPAVQSWASSPHSNGSPHVSRPTLMRKINAGEISSYKVGTHTRLRTADVLAERSARLQRQLAAFNELRALEDGA